MSLMTPYARHVLVCTGQFCDPQRRGSALYRQLQQLLGNLGDLGNPQRVVVSMTPCLEVCMGGPIVVVYPDGIWYHQVDEKALERIVDEHLRGDVPVADYIFHRLSPEDVPQNAASALNQELPSAKIQPTQGSLRPKRTIRLLMPDHLSQAEPSPRNGDQGPLKTQSADKSLAKERNAMGLFRFDTPQKVMKIWNFEVGGQPGERPPLLIANIFQTKDKLVTKRKPPTWDKVTYQDRIKELEEMSLETGIPTLVGIVAPTADEMKAYTEWFLSVNDTLPFGIDAWTEEARRGAARFIAEIGMQDRFNYNSITAWDPDIPDQVAELKELGIKSIILQPFDNEDKRATGRMKSLRQMLSYINEDDFQSILVDTTTMNLPTQGFCFLANRLVKKEFGLPAGNAPANGSYMWMDIAKKWGVEAFRGMDAGMHAVSAMFWQDWMVFGPTTGTKRIFAAVAAAQAMLAVMAWDEGLELPEAPDHPLNKHFPKEVEFMQGLRTARSDKLMERQKKKGEERRKAREAAAEGD